jgi:hypothetical protein
MIAKLRVTVPSCAADESHSPAIATRMSIQMLLAYFNGNRKESVTFSLDSLVALAGAFFDAGPV